MSQNYCPMCQKDTEYELCDDNLHCSICGKTQEVATSDAKCLKKAANTKRIKKVFKGIGIALALLMILWGYSVDSDRMLRKAAGITGIMLVVAIISGIVYGIRVLIQKFNRNK